MYKGPSFFPTHPIALYTPACDPFSKITLILIHNFVKKSLEFCHIFWRFWGYFSSKYRGQGYN